MLAEFVEKIAEMARVKTFDINGSTYSSEPLELVERAEERPHYYSVSTLESIVQLIRAEIADIDSVAILVHAVEHDLVKVDTTYLSDYSRNELYIARADIPGFNEGWRERECAIIELRSLFIPSEGTEYLLSLLSRISNDSSVTTSDNGVTQKVEAKQGIALNVVETVRPRVSLRPFRTFLEVDQPESEYLIRVDPEKGIGFFEADGGVWKLEAKRNIAAYFKEKLADLIEAGKVVVLT